MENKFGDLLREYRKAQRLTQRGLLDLLWDTEECDREDSEGKLRHKYNEPDVSKWESGSTKPPANVVELLEDILPTPRSLLLKAAGYHTEAELRRLGKQARKETETTEAFGLRHQDRLTNVAEELKSCLEFYNVLTPEILQSVIDPDSCVLDSPHCFFDGSQTWFSAEDSPLYDCLLEHLNAEFPEFSQELEQVREMAAEWFKEKKKVLWHEVANGELPSDLRDELWLVAERGIFKGKCRVCKDYRDRAENW